MDELGNLEALGPEHDLNGFDCDEAALNDWLKRHALKNQSRNNTRTFVLATLQSCGKRVVAFYSLVVATITHEEALQPLREGASPKNPIPVILLARLGVAKEYQGKGIGPALLKDALKLSISQQVGVRAVLVHAKTARAASFYAKYAGFEPSPTDPLHLLLPIQDIAKALK
jgi:GNAT superfamily N-acetyltransferase